MRIRVKENTRNKAKRQGNKKGKGEEEGKQKKNDKMETHRAHEEIAIKTHGQTKSKRRRRQRRNTREEKKGKVKGEVKQRTLKIRTKHKSLKGGKRNRQSIHTCVRAPAVRREEVGIEREHISAKGNGIDLGTSTRAGGQSG